MKCDETIMSDADPDETARQEEVWCWMWENYNVGPPPPGSYTFQSKHLLCRTQLRSICLWSVSIADTLFYRRRILGGIIPLICLYTANTVHRRADMKIINLWVLWITMILTRFLFGVWPTLPTQPQCLARLPAGSRKRTPPLAEAGPVLAYHT